MTRRNRDVLIANILYAIASYGLLAIPFVFTLILTAMALLQGGAADMQAALTPYGASYNFLMVVSEFLPLVLPGAILLALRKNRGMAASLRLRFRPSVLLAIPAAVVGYFFVVGLVTVWTALLQLLGAGSEATADLPADGVQLMVSLAVIALVPALCEEFLFRGLIMPAYERYFRNPWSAILLSGLIFALLHGQMSGLPGHVFLGMVLGFVVIATDSLWTGVLYHLTNNAVAMLLAYFSRSLSDVSFFAENAAVNPLQLMLGGLFWMGIGGALLAGFIVLYARMYLRGRKTYQAALQAPSLELGGPAGGFMPWVPLVVSAPTVAFKYLASLAMLYADKMMQALGIG